MVIVSWGVATRPKACRGSWVSKGGTRVPAELEQRAGGGGRYGVANEDFNGVFQTPHGMQ